MGRADDRGKTITRIAAWLVVLLSLISCASQPGDVRDSRQTIRRKPVPNLDRTYDWGSRPPPGPAETHSRD